MQKINLVFPIMLKLSSKIYKNIIFLKRIFYNFAYSFLLFLLATSCSSSVDFPGFDKEAWKADVRSCQNKRPALALVLKKNREKIIGLNHTEVLGLLGRPESSSLEKSGERVYYYFIEPGEQCKNNNLNSKANKIFIRFDALDRAYKIRFQNEI